MSVVLLRPDVHRLCARVAIAGALGLLALLAAPLAADAAPPRTLYVADRPAEGPGTISQFSLRGPAGRPVPLRRPKVSTGGQPQHVALTADGRFAYVSAAELGEVYAYRVRRADGGLVALPGGAAPAGVGAHGVVVSPGDRSVYVAAQGPGAVFQYDIEDDGSLTPKSPPSVPSGPNASGVAVAPDGRTVYVTNLGEGTVSQYDVDPRTGALTPKSPATVPAPPGPSGLGVNPDGRTLYVDSLSGRVAQYRIDRRDGRLRRLLPFAERVGRGSAGIATTPDGRFVYTPDASTDAASQFAASRRTGRLTALDPPSVAAGDGPEGIAAAPNGRSVYVVNAGSATVSWLRVRPRTGLLVPGRPAAVATGPNPHGDVVSPNQGPVARLARRRRDRVVRVGEPVRLSAARSHDRDGEIARYAWRFGDGRTRPNGPPKLVHRYRRPGRYTVRVTVTDSEGCSTRFVYTGQTASCNGGPAATASRRVVVRR